MRTGWYPGKKTIALATILACAVAVWWFQREDLPSYKGRTVAQWFAAFQVAGGWGHWVTEGSDDEITRAIVAGLGEDALPFLTRKANRSAAFFESRNYRSLLNTLPKSVAWRMPAPRPDSRPSALYLMGAIGDPQLQQTWNIKGNPARSTHTAVAALRKALGSGELQLIACQVLANLGPAGLEALPDLLTVLAARHSAGEIPDQVLRTVGALGENAGDAVPLLTRVVEDKRLPRPQRVAAAMALGDIGFPARSAGPAIGRLMTETWQTNIEPHAIGLEMALARTGGTPPEAVAVLEQVTLKGGALRRAFAMVASWDQDPGKRRYIDRVSEVLKAPLQSSPAADAMYCAAPLVAALGCHGTNAAVFASEVRALAESKDPRITNLACQALGRIEPARRD